MPSEPAEGMTLPLCTALVQSPTSTPQPILAISIPGTAEDMGGAAIYFGSRAGPSTWLPCCCEWIQWLCNAITPLAFTHPPPFVLLKRRVGERRGADCRWWHADFAHSDDFRRLMDVGSAAPKIGCHYHFKRKWRKQPYPSSTPLFILPMSL